MFDTIVIGSRCAGAPTAMLLARRGRRVLVLDRATFPSDVLSGHTIQPAGVARLARWGLLDRVRATGAPFCDRVRFDFGDVVLDGHPAPVVGEGHDPVAGAVSIRRTVIDPLLADAAAEAGAELRFGWGVTDLLVDGDRVVGVRGHDGEGREFEERAAVVVGADGANSFVARRVGARYTVVAPATTVTLYSYWAGTGLDHLSLAVRPSAFFVATPTNDDLTFVGVQLPLERAAGLAGRTEATFHEAVAASPAHAGLVATGPRVERFRVARTPDGFFRRSHGPGWALAGDAGHHKDPITAQGMGDAFRDADLLAAAIDHGLDGGPAALDAALAHYEATRDAESAAMFELTTALADVAAPPPPEALELVAALARRPEHIPRYLGVMAGSVPVAEFHDPANIAAICGVPA